MADVRVTQTAAEIGAPGDPSYPRVTQTGIEIASLQPLAEGVRVTQTLIEVASVQVSPELRQTQGLIEIASPHQMDLAWFGRGSVVGTAGAGQGKYGWWI